MRVYIGCFVSLHKRNLLPDTPIIRELIPLQPLMQMLRLAMLSTRLGTILRTRLDAMLPTGQDLPLFEPLRHHALFAEALLWFHEGVLQSLIGLERVVIEHHLAGLVRVVLN